MKNVVLGVTGGIAAYKALDIVSGLKKKGVEVDVVMTESAQEFVRPLSFQSLSQNPVITDMFEEPKVFEIAHISLAKKADVVCIAPATANIISKLANGAADDFLSTMCLATRAKIIVAPAMNTNMLSHPVTAENIAKLENLGYKVLGTGSGRLACGDVGEGKLLPPEIIVDEIMEALSEDEKMEDIIDDNLDDKNTMLSDTQSLARKKIIITAGPTCAPIDPVRMLTNRSSGKTGYALAEEARERGAEVVLISGTDALQDPSGIETFHVTTNSEMYDEVLCHFESSDAVIMAAAVADYKISSYSEEKIKKSGDELTLTFTKDRDILKSLGEIKTHQKLIGFAAESQNFMENAMSKLKSKNLDLIVLNDIGGGKVFGKDETRVIIMGDLRESEETGTFEGTAFMDSGEITKKKAAGIILDTVEGLFAE